VPRYSALVLDDVLLRAAGSLRRSYEDVDWAATPLGAVATWSPALVNAVDFVLHTRFPVTLFWGPEFVMVYNPAYVPLIADKHPAALGRRAREVFPEAWDTIGPMMQGVLAGDGATWVEDAHVPLQRDGILEEAYFTFSYSPIRSADGTIEGVMDIAAETTRTVVDRRRLRLLGRLGDDLAAVGHAGEVVECALAVLAHDGDDIAAAGIRLPGASGATGDVPLPDAPSLPLRDGRDLTLDETPAGRFAWLPLTPPAGSAGAEHVLVVALSAHLRPDPAYLEFLSLIAASIGQALDRATARDAERAVAAAEHGMSEALQRSLLTAPRETAGLELAARYQPAAEQAKIGGDWYDSFVLPDDSLTVVIGDVSGHDREAAAAMAQVRNLLRGVSYTLQKPPARVLCGLDEAMTGLDVNAFATAIIAQLPEPGPDAGGDRTLIWSNAGHPPPVLVAPDGAARLLSTAPDLLLGVGTGDRADHEAILAPGSTVVFYTDGLVERRGVPISDSLRWLTDLLQGTHALAPAELCDHLIAQLADGVEDDVALLVLRVR
jgi:serine phosphatase RsbU (regulator of sigma subunit)